jgi:hypothetical protein
MVSIASIVALIVILIVIFVFLLIYRNVKKMGKIKTDDGESNLEGSEDRSASDDSTWRFADEDKVEVEVETEPDSRPITTENLRNKVLLSSPGLSGSDQNDRKKEESEVKFGKKSMQLKSSPVLHTMNKSVKCNICFGYVKPGLLITTCSCGKRYHEQCAKRLKNCPICGTSIKSAVEVTGGKKIAG